MRKQSRRIGITAALVISGAYLMAGPGTGCLNFAAESAFTTADFCFIFDCQNGILGGTIDPCPDTNFGEDLLFVDCP